MTESSSSAVQEQAPPGARSRRLLWGGVILFLCLMGVSLYLSTYRRRLRPGEVVDDFGTYISPRGRYRITIQEQSDGLVTIDVESKASGLSHFSSYQHGYSKYLDREREWMICFDEFDRLWYYMGGWAAESGAQRSMPGGLEIPEDHCVQLTGWFLNGGRYSFGKTIVNESKSWHGVPPEFFNRLPRRSDPGWPDASSVPAHPLPFSKSQLESLGGK